MECRITPEMRESSRSAIEHLSKRYLNQVVLSIADESRPRGARRFGGASSRHRPKFPAEVRRSTAQIPYVPCAISDGSLEDVWESRRLMWSCAMTSTEAITESVSATVESMELPAVLHRFRLDPRYRVCLNDQLRDGQWHVGHWRRTAAGAKEIAGLAAMRHTVSRE
jgi:hypothetical protein